MKVPHTWGESRKCCLFLDFMIYSFLKLVIITKTLPSSHVVRLFNCLHLCFLLAFVYVNYLHEFYWVFPGPWTSLFRDTSLVSSLSTVSHVRGLGDQDCLPSLLILLKSHRAGCLSVCCGTGAWESPRPRVCTHFIVTKRFHNLKFT